MVAQRIYLGVFGVIFLASGIFTFFDPHAMGHALGIAPVDISGETEIRAMYGGLVVGSGLLLISGLFWRELAIAALAGTVFGGGGLGGHTIDHRDLLWRNWHCPQPGRRNRIRNCDDLARLHPPPAGDSRLPAIRRAPGPGQLILR